MQFDADGNITIRQSWLDTAMRCGERGRFAITKPEWDSKSSDSATIGTAAHAAIEGHVTALNTLDVFDPLDLIVHAVDAELEQGMKWTKYTTRQHLIDNAVRCYEAWIVGILPEFEDRGLIDGARTEVNFTVPLYHKKDGRLVSLTGTVDLVPNLPELADWKTASQPFRAHEKQKYAIQPTIYALAAIKGGLDSADHPKIHYSWPMDFHYGIMVRGEREAKPQILSVRRTEEHALFAIERIKGYVDLALDYGLDKTWPRDDDHFLCSQTWCPWWSICKGAHGINDTRPD